MSNYSSDPPLTLVISLAGHNKVSMAFHAGALCAMRDLGLLQRTKVLCGSGTGNWVLGFLMHALQSSVAYIIDHGPKEWRLDGNLSKYDRCTTFTRAWNWLTSPDPIRFEKTGDAEDGVKDGFLDFFLRPLLRFCETGVSGACVKKRLLRPWRWTQPWATELLWWAQENLFVGCNWADCLLSQTSCDPSTRRTSQEPVFAMQCYHEDNQELLTLSNDCHLPLVSLDQDQVKHFGPPLATHALPLSRAVTLLGLPLSLAYELHGMPLLAGEEHKDSPCLFPSLLYDPLSLSALRHYYLRYIYREPADDVDPCVCVVIDAVSGTARYHQDRAFRSLVDLQGQMLVGNRDIGNFEPRALRHRIVRAIDPLFFPRPLEDGDEPESKDPTFLDHLRLDHSELEALPPDFVRHVANWGKAVTHFHFDPLGVTAAPLLFPGGQASAELFGFSKLLARGDPSHLSLQLHTRQPRDWAPVLEPPVLELPLLRVNGNPPSSVPYENEQVLLLRNHHHDAYEEEEEEEDKVYEL